MTALEGTLHDMSVVNLIQVFTISKRDGILVLMMAGVKGVLFLEDGQIIHAAIMLTLTNEVLSQGDSAFYAMLRWHEARFWFSGTPVLAHPARTVTADSSYLLMEGLRRLDQEATARTTIAIDSQVRQSVGGAPETVVETVNDIARQVLLRLGPAERRVTDLAQETGLGELLTLMTVAELIDAGLLERTVPRPALDDFDGFAGFAGFEDFVGFDLADLAHLPDLSQAAFSPSRTSNAA